MKMIESEMGTNARAAAYFFSTNIEKADAPFQQVFKNLWKEHPLYCFIFSECFY